MLKFDEATTRLLEEVYHGSDFATRRRASFDAASPRRGERILDLGCGNGMLTLDLSLAVGDTGHVTGLDVSPEMLAAAQKRCAGRGNVSFLERSVEATTLPDASIDKVVSIQVFEYLADAQPALQEIHRVLVPGGYLVIGDMHWDTFAWHSANPARMAKMQAAYQHHLANPDVPALLPTMLRSAGFEDVKLTPLVFCDTDLRPRGLAELVMTLTQSFAVQNDLVAPEIAEDWAQEQRELAADGKFFFSLTHFVVSARRSHSA